MAYLPLACNSKISPCSRSPSCKWPFRGLSCERTTHQSGSLWWLEGETLRRRNSVAWPGLDVTRWQRLRTSELGTFINFIWSEIHPRWVADQAQTGGTTLRIISKWRYAIAFLEVLLFFREAFALGMIGFVLSLSLIPTWCLRQCSATSASVHSMLIFICEYPKNLNIGSFRSWGRSYHGCLFISLHLKKEEVNIDVY